MIKESILSIQRAGLDLPFPLKYSNNTKQKVILLGKLVEGYEHNTIWMHMGPLFVELVQKVDPTQAKKYREAYTKLIEKNKNFLEVFHPDGTPFTSPFYYADEGMVWAANYLTLKQKEKKE